MLVATTDHLVLERIIKLIKLILKEISHIITVFTILLHIKWVFDVGLSFSDSQSLCL